MIQARLIDPRGAIAVLAAPPATSLSSELAPRAPDFSLHASRPDDVVVMAARTLLEGRSVGLFDAGGLTAFTVTRIEHIANVLRGIEKRRRMLEWTAGPLHGQGIDGERGAIEWFLRSPTDVLIVAQVAFEKVRQPARGARRSFARRAA